MRRFAEDQRDRGTEGIRDRGAKGIRMCGVRDRSRRALPQESSLSAPARSFLSGIYNGRQRQPHQASLAHQKREGQLRAVQGGAR